MLAHIINGQINPLLKKYIYLLHKQRQMFSKACEYGIRAAIYIAEQSQLDRKVGLKEVAESIDSPIAYTSKILQQLSRSKIINSEKGPNGGFSMDKQELDKVKLSTIVMAIDGEEIYKGCGLGLKQCNEKMPCPVHDQFKLIRDKLKTMLETTSVQSLAVDFEKGLTFLKR
ncbi:MAG TPA: Rrf2 family transcriptional regulator [Daejeonella sp.]|jgi:Rrf2 family protein|uniref:RrF2 family transcriptional regulator n=1 Tax=Daejeonella sp. TaxID=2805397 RepID=UPI002ED988B3